MMLSLTATREQPRVLVAETEVARIYELWSPYGRPSYEVERTETDWFATYEEAAACAGPDTCAIFLRPGEAALVARPWYRPEPWTYEVWWVDDGYGNDGELRGALIPIHEFETSGVDLNEAVEAFAACLPGAPQVPGGDASPDSGRAVQAAASATGEAEDVGAVAAEPPCLSILPGGRAGA